MRNRKHRRFRRTLRRWHRGMTAYLRAEGRLWLWFASALTGVLVEGFFEAVQAGKSYHLSRTHTLMALVATLVTFQATFQRYRAIPANTPLLIQASLGFQCGFFWQTLFNGLAAAPLKP